DLKLPDDGLAAAATIVREHPSVRIVILTASDCDSDVAAMLQVGVHGYLLKGCTGQEIIRAVQRVYAGDFYVTPSLATRLLSEMPPPAWEAGDSSEGLSGREEIILAQVSKGLTNKEIARALNLREKTVKHYMTHIMQKLGVRNRLEAVLMGQKRQRTSGSLPPVDAVTSMARGRAPYAVKKQDGAVSDTIMPAPIQPRPRTSRARGRCDRIPPSFGICLYSCASSGMRRRTATIANIRRPKPTSARLFHLSCRMARQWFRASVSWGVRCWRLTAAMASMGMKSPIFASSRRL